MARIDLGDNMRKPVTVMATATAFYQRTDSEKTGRICAELTDILEQWQRGELTKEEYRAKKSSLKLGAAFYTPHAHFNKGYKSGEGEPVDSGKALIDVDGNPNGREIYEQRLKGRERALGVNMMNISISGTGFAVLFDMPEGMTRQQAQAWMAHELGDVDYDKAVHERERGIYIPCREYILYIDEELMFGDELHPAVLSEECRVNSEVSQPSTLNPKQYPKEYHGMTFDDILKKYWEVNNGGYEPTEGDRDTLTFQLASDLRHICGKNFAWLDQVIPCYDGFPLEEKRQKIRNALASKYEGMPTRLKAAIDALEREKRGMRFAAAAGTGNDGEQDQTLLPPAMPKRLPRLVQLLTSKTPDEYKAAVAHAVFPPLGTHLCGVRFKYTDNVEHEATLMNCLMAGTGAGKGCIDEPISHIMANIKRRDEDNVHREAEWKKDCLESVL